MRYVIYHMHSLALFVEAIFRICPKLIAFHASDGLYWRMAVRSLVECLLFATALPLIRLDEMISYVGFCFFFLIFDHNHMSWHLQYIANLIKTSEYFSRWQINSIRINIIVCDAVTIEKYGKWQPTRSACNIQYYILQCHTAIQTWRNRWILHSAFMCTVYCTT